MFFHRHRRKLKKINVNTNVIRNLFWSSCVVQVDSYVNNTQITRKDSLMFTNGINTSIGEFSDNSLHELSIRSLSFNDASHLSGREKKKKTRIRSLQAYEERNRGEQEKDRREEHT